MAFESHKCPNPTGGFHVILVNLFPCRRAGRCIAWLFGYRRGSCRNRQDSIRRISCDIRRLAARWTTSRIRPIKVRADGLHRQPAPLDTPSSFDGKVFWRVDHQAPLMFLKGSKPLMSQTETAPFHRSASRVEIPWTRHGAQIRVLISHQEV